MPSEGKVAVFDAMSRRLQHSTGLPEQFPSLGRNCSLVLVPVKREAVGRHRGSVFDLAWLFFNPLLMFVIYTFKARWGEAFA